VVIVIALIGAVYYLLVGRTKAFAPVTAPPPDDDPVQPAGGTEAASAA
jgi:hypothetical protein